MTGPRKHHTPFDPADVLSCACANLRKTTRAVSQFYDAALQPTGLKAGQFTILATLDRRGESPVTRLAEALVMDRTTLTRNLKPLERQGLIAIAQDADQRVRMVALTAAGRQTLQDGRPLWESAQARLAESLGPERWSSLLTDLAATLDAVREP